MEKDRLSPVTGHGRDGIYELFGQNNFTSHRIGRISRSDRDLSISSLSVDGEAIANAGLMQTLVMKPAHFAIELFQSLQVGREQSLAIKKLEAFDKFRFVNDAQGSPHQAEKLASPGLRWTAIQLTYAFCSFRNFCICVTRSRVPPVILAAVIKKLKTKPSIFVLSI